MPRRQQCLLDFNKDVPKPFMTCVRAQETGCRNLRCHGFFPHKYGTEEIVVLSLHGIKSKERNRKGALRRILEPAVSALRQGGISRNGLSHRFVEWTLERYLG